MSHTLRYCRPIFKAKIKRRSKVLILVSIWGTCIRFSKGNHQSQAGPLLRPPWNSADNPYWWYRWNVICNTNTNTITRSRQHPSGHKYKYKSITWLQRRGNFSGHHCGPHKVPSQERFEGFKIYFLVFIKICLFAFTSGNFWHSHLFFCGNCLPKLFDTILHVRSLTRTYGKMLQIVLMTLWLYVRVITLFRNRKMVVSTVSFWVSIKLFTLSRHCT